MALKYVFHQLSCQGYSEQENSIIQQSPDIFLCRWLWLEIVQGYVQKLSLSKLILEQSQALLGKLDTAFITQQGNTKKEKQIYDGYTRTVP